MYSSNSQLVAQILFWLLAFASPEQTIQIVRSEPSGIAVYNVSHYEEILAPATAGMENEIDNIL